MGHYMTTADTSVAPTPFKRDPVDQLKHDAFKITRDFGMPDETALLLIAEKIGDITPYATGKLPDEILFCDKVQTIALQWVADGLPAKIHDYLNQLSLNRPIKNGWADSAAGRAGFCNRVRPGLMKLGFDSNQVTDVITDALNAGTMSGWQYWPSNSDTAERRVYDYAKEHKPMAKELTPLEKFKEQANGLFAMYEFSNHPVTRGNFIEKACGCKLPDYEGDWKIALDNLEAQLKEWKASKTAPQPSALDTFDKPEAATDETSPFDNLDTSKLDAVIEKSTETGQPGDSSVAGNPTQPDNEPAKSEPQSAPVSSAPEVTTEIIDDLPSEANIESLKSAAKMLAQKAFPDVTLTVDQLKAYTSAAWDGKLSADAIKAWGLAGALKRLEDHLAALTEPAPAVNTATMALTTPGNLPPPVPMPTQLQPGEQPNQVKFPNSYEMFMIDKYCRAAASTKLWEKHGILTYDQAFIVAMFGWELGLTPVMSFSHIPLIGNKPYPETIIFKGLAEASGHCRRFEVIGDANKATVTVQRDDRELQTFTFTREDATKAKLWESTPSWTKYPDKMLKWRATRDAVLTVFPDAALRLGAMGLLEPLDEMVA